MTMDAQRYEQTLALLVEIMTEETGQERQEAIESIRRDVKRRSGVRTWNQMEAEATRLVKIAAVLAGVAEDGA